MREAARKVKIEHLLDRKPGQLSGGQQQRCALARAIVRKARLFLLDEPLSNLDAKLRLETRVELKKLQRSLGVTAVYVTHDQEEAMTLADRMAVFMDGEVQQIGRPTDIFARPNSIDVAAFIGSPPMNLIPARYADGRVAIGDHSAADGDAEPSGSGTSSSGIRPSAVRIAPGRDSGDGRTDRASRRRRRARSPRRRALAARARRRRRASRARARRSRSRRGRRTSTSSTPPSRKRL